MINGVYIKPRFSTIYFDNVHSKTIAGVEEEKRECQETVYRLRERLAMLIAGNPKDLMGKDDWKEFPDVTGWIICQLNEIEEQIYAALQKYGELNIYEQLLEEWEHSSWSTEASWEDLYSDVKNTAESTDVFPEEKYADTDFKHDLLFGKIKIDDKSIEEAFNRGIENIKLDKDQQHSLYAKTYATVDGEIFVTYKGQWLFTSKEEAMNAIKHRLNIPILEYFKNDFIKNHPEFFDSMLKWLDANEQKKLKEYLDNFDMLTIMSPEYHDMYDLVKKAFDKYIESRVKTYSIYDEIVKK